MNEIPENIKQYLWDTPTENLSLLSHYRFIIERVLEFGDERAVFWMNHTFPSPQIIEVLKVSKRISVKTGLFYARIYQVNEIDLECLKKPFTQKQNRF